ncbi:MAG: fructose bisphosphate aldolase [Gammaproteobacteria bacterium]|nr:fructose bisphosphate aldolase [Gammaproteobacteria bacterium]
MYEQQLQKMKNQDGFIAALDQSGGSTPKALMLYGVQESEYNGEEEMFAKVHEMRSRIITNSNFEGGRIVGAILFEDTLDRSIEGKPTADYLWNEKQILPFLKIDKGLADEENGVQMMKPMPELDELLEKAKRQPVFGTKMRSVIKKANAEGIKAVVAQQFEVGKRIVDTGFIPIIEPEVDIHCPEKAEAEAILKAEILTQLDTLSTDQEVMLKLTLPETDNFYKELVEHKSVVRVVALSGGYSRDVANEKLSNNNGIIASFSRALSEGLSAQQSDEEFSSMLNNSINEIYKASST